MNKEGKSCSVIHTIAQAHIDSYNTFVQCGLLNIVSRIEPVSATVGSSDKLTIWLHDVKLSKAMTTSVSVKRHAGVSPKECRESGETYAAPLKIVVSWSLNGSAPKTLPVFNVCDVPVMVGSQSCSLQAKSMDELLRVGEEENEIGGYFIVGGIERVIRLLIQQRRHHVMALCRGSFHSRGSRFTKYATAIRCVDECERSSTVRAHYLSDGAVNVGLTLGRQEIFLPLALVLRALSDMSELELRARVSKGVMSSGKIEQGYVQESLEKIFEAGGETTTRNRSLEYIGSMFRTNFPQHESSAAEVGEYILRKNLFIHLRANGEKLDLLIFMLNKLLSLVCGCCKADDPDSLVNQEVLLPGFLLQNLLHEKLSEALARVKLDVEKLQSGQSTTNVLEKLESTLVTSMKRVDIGRQLEYFLATGNLVSKSGLGLSQTSGFTIVAEKLNYLRYISHFRSVHRGAYFAELRTTSVRKLLPESWGFLCPVHTPDGSPCGLLTHMTSSCKISTGLYPVNEQPDIVAEHVRAAATSCCQLLSVEESSEARVVPVILDGRILGYIPIDSMKEAEAAIRCLKVSIPSMQELEIATLPDSELSAAYPCLAMFSSSSRLMRPVLNNCTGHIELIGTMEQNSIHIELSDNDAPINTHHRATHRELEPSQMLSIVANLTPWSDFNQSPRNMYQCQMAKQTMGVPLHSFRNRSDTKLYRLHTPQRPISLTAKYDEYNVDCYPLGTNAVVAVLSHTGYDMEDAMIVNKSAVERGFAHATLYKTELFQLRAGEIFQKCSSPTPQRGHFDMDGLLRIGHRLTPAAPIHGALNAVSGIYREVKLKGADESVVDKIKRFGNGKGGEKSDRASVTLRFNRNPVIGDKFSSRHGQKGVLSFLWPDEALPFIERSGIRPDILINPHAFPSRMTIGMLVESLASKGAALLGNFVDASAFNTEKLSPLDVHGDFLRQLGYNHSGTETMTNGVTGETFDVDIYIGLVYYQRLRHMVSDKFQVRSTGPVNLLTKQPVKGRKAGGGVRFGEMERDSLLAHGAAYLLRDRLHLSSDSHVSYACTSCGSLISTISRASSSVDNIKAASSLTRCHVCEKNNSIELIGIPYVFKYLLAELAAMNIQVKISLV